MASFDLQHEQAPEVSDCDRQLLDEEQRAPSVSGSQEPLLLSQEAFSQHSAGSERSDSYGVVQISFSTKPSKVFVNGELRDAAKEFSDVLPTDSWLADRVVVMIIGPEQRKWAVHEKLLSSKSAYIHRILHETESGQDCKEVVLSDTDPKLFSMMLRWIYGTAFASSGGNRVFRYPVPNGVQYTVRDFLGLYVLGGQLEITGVKNAAIDAVYNYYNEETDEARCPSLTDVQMIFDNTPSESHMRRLLVAHVLFYMFSKKRDGRPVPPEWEQVMLSNGQIGWAMIQMLADWKWVMGSNVPPMRIKNRQAFHEPVVIDLDPPVKQEDADEGIAL